MAKRVIVLAVFFTSLAFYLSFNAYIPVTDPVESNYALTAKEMVLSGDWLSPSIYGHSWFDKPIMIYWLIALSFKIFGINEFAARFPAALFSAASVAFIYWFGKKLFNNYKIALLSAIVLGTSLEFWVLARAIITDAVLFFYTSVSLATFYLGLIKRENLWYVFAYVAAGLAVLTKGPVGFVLPGLIIISYIIITSQWQLFRRLFLLPGLIIFLLTATPWYFKMYQIHGRDFIDTFLGLHNYVRATVSEHPQDNVFYYYLILFPMSLLPWTGILFRFISLFSRDRKSPHLMFLAVWTAVIILFYNMMATKYPTYVFPASFPAALLCGYLLDKMQSMRERKVWLWLSIPTVVLIVIIGAGAQYIPSATNFNMLYICAIVSSALILWIQIKGNVYYMPHIVAIATVLMSLVFIKSGLIPLAEVRSAKNVVNILPEQGAIVASYGEYSTSAVFYSGYNMPRLVDEQDNQLEGSWSGKYTMPTERIVVFDVNTANNAMAYVLVKAKDQNSFMRESFAKNFVPVANYGTMTLYQRLVEF